MRGSERGQVFLLVLMLLSLGTLILTPSLRLTNAALKSKRVYTEIMSEQYGRDAAAEYAMWLLLFGGAAATLDQAGEEAVYTMTLNGVTTTITIKVNATPLPSGAPGAEHNRIRPTMAVECARDGDGVFNDDCTSLPAQGGMVARYTVFLEQVSPDTSAGLTTIYSELPKGFTLISGSSTSLDGSLPIPFPTAVDIQPGSRQIWKWTFSPAVTFQQGQIRQFTFRAGINGSKGRYCDAVFLKLQTLPNEKTSKVAPILVGAGPPEGCQSAGASVGKHVDKGVAPPKINTVFTYIVTVSSLDQNTLHIDRVKDVLPPKGFKFCSPSFPPTNPALSCDPPMYKLSNDPFNPVTDSFTSTDGYTTLVDPQQTFLTEDQRWELLWVPGGAGWDLAAAGKSGDNFILRFQAHVTMQFSGSFYNEVFADVDCAAPQSLIDEGVTTTSEYCATYSWPTADAVVIVPTYDIRASAGGEEVHFNAGEGKINSWNVQ